MSCFWCLLYLDLGVFSFVAFIFITFLPQTQMDIPPYLWLCIIASVIHSHLWFKNTSKNSETTCLKWHVFLSSMLNTWMLMLCLTQNTIHLFIQHVHAVYSLYPLASSHHHLLAGWLLLSRCPNTRAQVTFTHLVTVLRYRTIDEGNFIILYVILVQLYSFYC